MVLSDDAAQGSWHVRTNMQDTARHLSNITYAAGSMLLEASLAAANLAHAAGGNALPLLSAQTGFLAPDGSSSQVVNRGLRPWLNVPFQRPPQFSGNPVERSGG